MLHLAHTVERFAGAITPLSLQWHYASLGAALLNLNASPCHYSNRFPQQSQSCASLWDSVRGAPVVTDIVWGAALGAMAGDATIAGWSTIAG